MMSLSKGDEVALALGGGAVLGAVHVGVIKALEELDIKISYISGTSVGALVAGFYAFDVHIDKVEEIALDLSWKDITDFSLSKYALFSNSKIKHLLDRYIGEVSFEESRIPLSIIATDIINGEKVVLEEGSVASGIMASTCIPGMFKPIWQGDRLLVDGGIVENVPVSPLLRWDVPIIAVDLNKKITNQMPSNVIEVLYNSFHLSFATLSQLQMEEANILIQPDLSKYSRMDTKNTQELIKIGYEETLSVLDS